MLRLRNLIFAPLLLCSSLAMAGDFAAPTSTDNLAQCLSEVEQNLKTVLYDEGQIEDLIYQVSLAVALSVTNFDVNNPKYSTEATKEEIARMNKDGCATLKGWFYYQEEYGMPIAIRNKTSEIQKAYSLLKADKAKANELAPVDTGSK